MLSKVVFTARPGPLRVPTDSRLPFNPVSAEGRYWATAASRGSVLLPVIPRRIPNGVWIYGSCRLVPLLANCISGHLSSVDHRLVLGWSRSWTPPLSPDNWAEWTEQTESALGRSIESWVVHLPTDPRRQRFGLLLLDELDRPRGFAKFSRASSRSMALRAQQMLTASPGRTFQTPGLILHGELDGWAYTVSTPLISGPHRPAYLAAPERWKVIDELQRILRPLEDPNRPGQVAMHGDFGPWNVRRLGGGQLAVIDWEDVGLGPPKADELWHVLQTCLIRYKDLPRAIEQVDAEISAWEPEPRSQAVRYWIDWMDAPEPPEIDESVARPEAVDAHAARMAAALRQLASGRLVDLDGD